MGKSQTVEEFLSALSHRRIDDIRALRRILLGVDPGVSERIKWNAPSFCWAGDDRITMRLHPGDRLELILHRGVKTKDASTFRFVDPTGRIEWAAPDRGVVRINDPEADIEELVALAKAWFAATA
ncbi:hypothetical protein CHU93_01795 [Sandarakinorhabdus cyanobacteriorum]|uniref:YdhG-like domain-containing protein n=1 Tax=Sandarakinorhabdus cyanobacteriorum TaxID=1981098 RepID=A0A255Z1R9_9SPHN|nr:DUF1801 domain-containing protein [Sandarakinorhabdus cyanobacteriorum]OYQ35418.1 hypothetical protein CHU93_01795 [Sandarakinorhabdus cyanobacteriorum]